MCQLGIGGTPYISHKIMALKPSFHIFDWQKFENGKMEKFGFCLPDI